MPMRKRKPFSKSQTSHSISSTTTGPSTTGRGSARQADPLLGVVIPALNEAGYLPALLADLSTLGVPHQVLVVDGGSTDSTAAVVRGAGARVLRTALSRGRQMNAGARSLDTPWLLFLHADCRLGPLAREALERHLSAQDVGAPKAQPRQAAHFRFAVAGGGPFFRALELGQRVRERLFGLVYGDQGLLVPRALFQEVGGFPDQPLMEDVLMTKRLIASGRLVRLEADLETSPRRYLEEGRLLRVSRNLGNLIRFSLGTEPGTIVRSYRPRNGSPRPQDLPGHMETKAANNTLLVFAKAARPGSVKTRLAKSVGNEQAAALYRQMARRVVDQVAGGNHESVICFDPQDGESEVRELLGPGPWTLTYQGEGDLGDRMSRCLTAALTHATKAIVIGTDAPALTGELIHLAFQALDEADVVIGPTFDGGYYLLGLRRPAPELFEGIDWSSPEVLRQTVARADRLELNVTYLERLGDVDTVEDLTPEILATLEAPLSAPVLPPDVRP
ncbi:MAG: TIGR04282 family arsenosugar biosynthesis glycosyltransferase [Longimicrobiales bacterium]